MSHERETRAAGPLRALREIHGKLNAFVHWLDVQARATSDPRWTGVADKLSPIVNELDEALAAAAPKPAHPSPDYAPSWKEINQVRDRADKILGTEYLGWNWVHALVDKLEKASVPPTPYIQDHNAQFGFGIFVVTGEHQRTAFFTKEAAEQYLAQQHNPERFRIVVYPKPLMRKLALSEIPGWMLNEGITEVEVPVEAPAVLARWIKDANDGRIKIGKRQLSNNDLALIVRVLQAVAADVHAASVLDPGLDVNPPKHG